MSYITYEQLLKAGAHFGHQPRKWNPAMAPYIFMERNNTHIIDLHKTVAKVDEAAEVIKNIVASGKKVLFVATKKQVREPVERLAASVDMPYVTERWPGGMLTNFPTIRKAVKKMLQIDKMKQDGTFENLNKRERLQIDRQRAKLEKNLGSIKDMNRLPAALFIVDVLTEDIAVREATRLGIPIFAIVDTNANPKPIDYVIPANDDSVDAVEAIVGAMCAAISEGLIEYKATAPEETTEEDETVTKETTSRSGRKTRTGARRERVKDVEIDAQTAKALAQEQEESEANQEEDNISETEKPTTNEE